jgi:hypothetical protein
LSSISLLSPLSLLPFFLIILVTTLLLALTLLALVDFLEGSALVDNPGSSEYATLEVFPVSGLLLLNFSLAVPVFVDIARTQHANKCSGAHPQVQVAVQSLLYCYLVVHPTADQTTTCAPNGAKGLLTTERRSNMDAATKATVQKIPLLTVNAGPRDGNDIWVKRLKEEYAALIKV